MSSVPQLVLDSKKSRHFDGRHPWVLANSIQEPKTEIEAGQVVELLQPNGSWIGRGVYNPNSRVRLRLLQWQPEQELNNEWICHQLSSALQLRKDRERTSGELEALRLVNSEGDGLSGLVVDRFANYLVVQFTSLAMLKWREQILDWLQHNIAPDNILCVMDENAAKQEGTEPFSIWQQEGKGSTVASFREHDVELTVDLKAAQKTGYYLDQRSNRLQAALAMQAGSLLDVCCYQAGFSLVAAKHAQIDRIVAVDSSQRALEAAEQHAARNAVKGIEFQKADCFDYLQQLVQDKQTFDNIVLDPPRMAGHRSQINSALRAYHRLNLSAVNLLRPGGTLVTCSCSGRVFREDFWGVLSSVAKRSRRRIQVIEGRGADFDHPIDVNCPESDYLKCFICRVN